MVDPFKIYQIGTKEAKEINNAVNDVHAHNFEELIIGVKGQLEHFIDFDTTVSDTPFVSFVTKGKVHRVQPIPQNGECEIWVIRFQSDFIPETTFHLYALYHDNANISLKQDFCFNRLSSLCEMMDDEMRQPTPDYLVIRNLLTALFSMIESEKRKQQPENTLKTQSTTFKNFLKILEENFRRPEGVEFYAEKLFMSSRNLNLICQSILQQSVSEIIETRKHIEAKNLLASTDKSISEIGFELGYNEKSYFSNVFKKKSGQTPTVFREEIKKLIS